MRIQNARPQNVPLKHMKICQYHRVCTLIIVFIMSRYVYFVSKSRFVCIYVDSLLHALFYVCCPTLQLGSNGSTSVRVYVSCVSYFHSFTIFFFFRFDSRWRFTISKINFTCREKKTLYERRLHRYAKTYASIFSEIAKIDQSSWSSFLAKRFILIGRLYWPRVASA